MRIAGLTKRSITNLNRYTIRIEAGCAYFCEDFQPEMFVLTFLEEFQTKKNKKMYWTWVYFTWKKTFLSYTWQRVHSKSYLKFPDIPDILLTFSGKNSWHFSILFLDINNFRYLDSNLLMFSEKAEQIIKFDYSVKNVDELNLLNFIHFLRSLMSLVRYYKKLMTFWAA